MNNIAYPFIPAHWYGSNHQQRLSLFCPYACKFQPMPVILVSRQPLKEQYPFRPPRILRCFDPYSAFSPDVSADSTDESVRTLIFIFLNDLSSCFDTSSSSFGTILGRNSTRVTLVRSSDKRMQTRCYGSRTYNHH